MSPSFTSGWPNFALSDAMRTWHAIASSQPPPSAKPFTAAIVGLGDVSKRRKTDLAALRERLAPNRAVTCSSSEMSAPATNARPAPVRMTPPTSRSARSESIASPSSAITRSLSAFSLSGRLTVIVAIRSATVSVIVS